MATIRYPFGKPEIIVLPTAAATYTLTIANDYTIIDAKSLSCSKSRKIALLMDKWLQVGAKMTIMQKASGGKGITLSTGFSGLAKVTAAAGKLTTCDFIYDGTNFVPSGGAYVES